MGIRHAFTSAKEDWPDTSIVRPSDWNADHISGDTSWTALGLSGSWTNYDNGYNTAGYRKDGCGFVHLRGLITGGAAGSTIATLPSGYRPEATCLFPVNASQTFGRVDVQASGAVVCQNTSGTGWISLEGLTFMAV